MFQWRLKGVSATHCTFLRGSSLHWDKPCSFHHSSLSDLRHKFLVPRSRETSPPMSYLFGFLRSVYLLRPYSLSSISFVLVSASQVSSPLLPTRRPSSVSFLVVYGGCVVETLISGSKSEISSDLVLRTRWESGLQPPLVVSSIVCRV